MKQLEGHAPREGEYHLSARIQAAEQTTAKSHVSRERFQRRLGVGLASKPSFTMGTKWPAACPLQSWLPEPLPAWAPLHAC